MFRARGFAKRLGLGVGLLVLMGISVGSGSAHADFIFLGAQTNTPEFQFIGTGTNVIDINLEDCTGGVCDMASGSAGGTGVLFAFDGTYEFSTTSSSPFTLNCLGGGEFSVSQTTPIDFAFSSSTGTLTGTVTFTHVSDLSATSSSMAGVLTVTGGTFAPEFPSGFGDVQMTLANFALQGLCGTAPPPFPLTSEFDTGTITPTPVSTGTCPLTQGFWKTHPAAWPVLSLTVGGRTLSEATLINILQTAPKKGDASLILLHQLIAALLNVDSGSVPDATVAAAITDAQSLLTSNISSTGVVTFVSASSTIGQKMISDAETLDSFNSGAFSVGCQGE